MPHMWTFFSPTHSYLRTGIRAGFTVAALTFAACSKPGGPLPGAGGGGPPALTVEIFEVVTRPFNQSLRANGTLLPNEAVVLQSERSGFVTEILYTEGKPVPVGTILLRIDDTELRAELQRAEARLALEIATEQRQRGLLGQRGISAAAYDESLANLNIARAEAGLIRAQLAKTVIRAPFDGVPGLREVSVGSFLTPGTRIGTFQDVASLKIDFSVPERYRPFVQIGQSLKFRVAGQSGDFDATIYAIEPGIDVNTRSVLLRARVPNSEGQLQPGAFTEIEIALEEDPNAILIPSIALIPGLKRQTVFLYEEGKVVEREVAVGLRTADDVQIVEGLQPGDQVITTGILQLRPGMTVSIQPKAPAKSAT